MTITAAIETDEPGIIEIYNQAVSEQFCTADTEPVSVSSRRAWFDEHRADTYPIFVDRRDTLIAGWCSLSPYRAGRQALREVAEMSYYVHRDWRGQGIGGGLVEHALQAAPGLGFLNLLAILLDVNTPSIGLLQKHGFTEWGHLPRIANFQGTRCGQYVYGRALDRPSAES